MASIEDMLDDMGDMGEIELDLDEDALLADDDDKTTTNSRIGESKIEDEDFIEIGVEDDIDDLKVDAGDKKSAMAYDENDSEDENKERSRRFKAERNISSVPRPNNAIPETLDAVPVKTNFTTPSPRGKRNFRGGPVRRGHQRPGPPNGQNFQPIHPRGPPPPQHPPHPPYSGNIHVNPHFRNNLNLPGNGAWNGWAPEQRSMPPHHFQDPNYGNHWNENNRVDYYQQQQYGEQNYYNNGDQYYNNYPQQWDQYYPPHDYRYPMDHQFRNAGPNNFGAPPNFGPMHPMRFPPPPKMAKFRGGRGGVVLPPVKTINNNQGYQLKQGIKQQRSDALRKVQISNLHEVKMVDQIKTSKAEPEEEDEDMKEYRLKIEEQKKLREAVLRQKEEKRKAAQQKSQIEAGGADSGEEKVEGAKSEEYRIVRVRGPDGTTVVKRLTLEQISKLKKVETSEKSVKDDIVSQTVAIDNLSASTTTKQIEEMAKMVGPHEKISLDPIAKKAVIKFNSEESAILFMKRNQRKMVDLSMITVRLIPNE